MYERHSVTMKLFAMDAIAILGTQPARIHVLQVGGHSSLSKWPRHVWAGGPICLLCTQRRNTQMDVSCSWGFGRPGIG